MYPESSVPYTQVPATSPYPEPTPSSSHKPLRLPEDPSLYYPPIYIWVSPLDSFPQVSWAEPCAHLSPPQYALHAPPISTSTARIFSETRHLNIISKNCGEDSGFINTVLENQVPYMKTCVNLLQFITDILI
jgi:hypothetical protein